MHPDWWNHLDPGVVPDCYSGAADGATIITPDGEKWTCVFTGDPAYPGYSWVSVGAGAA